MTRPPRSSVRTPGFRGRRTGVVRERRVGLTTCSPELVRERLDTFASAFLADARPGLVFEYGHLVFANTAARSLLRSTDGGDDFLNDLTVSVEAGAIEPGLLLRARSGAYAPVLHPDRRRRGHPTRICLLVRRSASTAAYGSLSERELEVVSLLVKGFKNAEIAGQLGISVETVRKHVSKALEKTETKTRAGLVGRVLER